ncbi:MAG: trigger factor [Deltaproteobacteria bacterium]|nr:trigger factor [Deltaproteobacteria bacterium]
MKVQVEEVSPIKKKLAIEVEPEQIRKEWDSVVKSFNKKVKLKGFRTGKIPITVLVKYYGPQIEEEVVSQVINRTYPEALKETEVIPITMPELDYPAVDKEATFIYTATIEIKPEILISEYQGLEVKKQVVPITEEDVEKRLAAIQASHGELVSLGEDRPLRKGDFGVIDYKSFLDDKEIPGGSAQNFDLEVGAGYFNAGFEKELEGMKKGEDKDFDIDFPDDFGNPSLAGKRVHYQVKLQEIKTRNLPELNDSFAQNLGKEFSSLEDLRKKIRNDLEQEENRKADLKLKEDLIDGLIAKSEFELPEALVNQEIRQMMLRIEQDFSRQGLSWEKAGLDPNSLMERFRPQAQKLARKKLLLEKVAQLESITVSPEEIEEELQRIARNVNQSVTLVKEIYNKNNLMPELNQQLLEEKTLNFLQEHATIQT